MPWHSQPYVLRRSFQYPMNAKSFPQGKTAGIVHYEKEVHVNPSH